MGLARILSRQNWLRRETAHLPSNEKRTNPQTKGWRTLLINYTHLKIVTNCPHPSFGHYWHKASSERPCRDPFKTELAEKGNCASPLKRKTSESTNKKMA